MLRVPRKRRPPDRDFPPLSTPAAQQTQSNFHVVPANLEAWTRSLVIDFWRSATFRQHTRATLQEYDLVMKKCQGENIDLGLDSEAWTQSLVIDFWRSATFRLHTRATLHEYDLVMRKCQELNINFGLDSEAWTESLLHENVSIEIDFHRNTFGAYCNTIIHEYYH